MAVAVQRDRCQTQPASPVIKNSFGLLHARRYSPPFRRPVPLPVLDLDGTPVDIIPGRPACANRILDQRSFAVIIAASVADGPQ